MFRSLLSVAAFISAIGGGAIAQSLTPEDIQKLVDDELSKANPYEALLGDPDPERSLAAMKIMLASGEDDLVKVALEYGLFSPNPELRQLALSGFLASEPVLTLRLDGSNADERWFEAHVVSTLNGFVDPMSIGFYRIDVGPKSEDGVCHTRKEHAGCFVTINSNGIFLAVPHGGSTRLRSVMEINDAGQLVGMARVERVDELIPLSIQLID